MATLGEMLKELNDDEIIDVYDTTECDWHRTLYEGPCGGIDCDAVSAAFPGRDTNIANEHVLCVYDYEDGICIGLANGTGR